MIIILWTTCGFHRTRVGDVNSFLVIGGTILLQTVFPCVSCFSIVRFILRSDRVKKKKSDQDVETEEVRVFERNQRGEKVLGPKSARMAMPLV